MNLELSVPDMKFFPSYLKALEEGFAYGSGDPFTPEEIAEIKADPEKHIVEMKIIDKSGDFIAEDGSAWPRVPQERIWITADENFIGAINFRPKLHEMLENYGGHVGYSITPSVRGKGYMTKALGLLLSDKGRMAKVDRDHLILGTDHDNEPSIKSIQKNGGVFARKSYSEPMRDEVSIYHIPLKGSV